MANPNSTQNISLKNNDEATILLGFISVVLFFIAVGFVAYWNIRTLNEDTQKVVHSHEVIIGLTDLASLMKDAETGQRGYVITGNASYLTPYNTALSGLSKRIKDVEDLTVKTPEQATRLPDIKAHITAKMAELGETIELRRNKGFQAAYDVIVADRGKAEMDQFRSLTSDMRDEQKQIRLNSLEEMNQAYRVAIISGLLTGLLGIALSIAVALLMLRTATKRARDAWLQAGESGLSAAMLGDQTIETLGENILKFLSQYFGAQAGAFFVRNGHGYKRIASYGAIQDSSIRQKFTLDDGLLGQAAKDKQAFFVNDVPSGYLKIGSSLGESDPRHLVIAPSIADAEVNAVFELGFINPMSEAAVELLNTVKDMIGVAVKSADYRSHLQTLLEETQRQSEELQTQSEELRVSNEELEEQSRALKDSQGRLEEQQAELEQTNSQLEEQAQQLGNQKDDLEKSKNIVLAKARELEQASQYKSDFLANMSHELRTPLNSSLILAKLLADNPAGNLTAEQVKFAETIENSGNDLLTLINDILDLSKIEAGHMEMRAEDFPIERTVKDIRKMFDPLAGQRNLKFETEISAECPPMINTDRMRLEQILKNLLANAIKFTEKGHVRLSVSKRPNGLIAFSVSDTGIGIAPDKQLAIFEAFRQADSTISRKFGGTGLGLSISKELTRLLGGQIELESKVGEGSTFTIVLPDQYTISTTVSDDKPVLNLSQNEPEQKLDIIIPRSSSLPDDRDHLTGKNYLILVVEDDTAFAQILYDMSHELNFECLLTNSAEEAIALARQYLPNAVILDIGLPDHSGLSVLDRLKHDPKTRHIPVHIVSANDYTETAFSLGAFGYLAKPVKRQELVDALKQLEAKFAQSVRRVLVVEDDKVQRESMAKLLGSHGVEIVGAATAAECLKLLKESAFDCMVLDLTLPDASGYSLLEMISQEDAYSFPPVIVYTGHDLSNDEEQRLRKYSKSIIIKGAKSPERLLDEVTLFLHQVVSELPQEQQKMLEVARNRDAILENRRVLIVEDDVANVFALTSILEPHGAIVEIARNGLEALTALEKSMDSPKKKIDLVLMDVMMPEMDGLTATRKIRKNSDWTKLPIIMLTAKAMRDDQERCLDAGANDYMAKPLDVENYSRW